MFEKLGQIISQQVTDCTTGKVGNNIARSLIILASTSLEKVKDMIQEKYPVHSVLDASFRIWIKGNSVETLIEDTVRRFLDVGEVAKLSADGFNIFERIGQIIIMADVSETGAGEKLANVLDSVDQVLNKCSAKHIFLVSIICIVPFEVNRKEAKEIISAAMNRGIVSRVFLIDNDNRHGLILKEQIDIVSLAGQLVAFLIRFAINAEEQSIKGDGEGYADWLRRNTGPLSVTGFSAYTVRMPMEEILNLTCVHRGTEIIEEVFLGVDEKDAHIYYANNCAKTTNTISREDLYAAILKENNKTIQDPTARIPKFNRFTPESYFNAVKEIYDGLAKAASVNQAILTDSYEKKYVKNLIDIEDHVESIMIQEMHGFSIAGRFITKFAESIKKGLITGANTAEPVLESIVGNINNIRDYLLKMPSRESIALRLFILLIACMTSLAVLPFSDWHKIIGLFLLSTMALAAGIIWVKISERMLENKIIKLENHINNKWEKLTLWHRDNAIIELSERLIEYVKTITIELDSAQNRLKSVIKYFREEYMPEAPSDNAFWRTQVTRREDLLVYKDKCQIDVLTLAKILFIEQRPQFLWRRLASSVTSGPTEPNNMEQHLLESAAIKILPASKPLMENNVINFIKSHPEYFTKYIRAIQQIRHPFLKTKPGEAENYTCMLDSVTDGSDFIVEGLINNYGSIKTIEAQNPYLLSFYCFWNDIPLDNILWE